MRYKGIAYPITKHPQGFFHNAVSDVAQIKSDMAAVILTEPTERLFLPYFGTNLKTVNLNAPLQLVRSEIRMRIATSLKAWEKRVQVTDIVVDISKNDTKVIAKISVYFINPVNINDTQTLVLYKSLGEGAMPF
jgi:phage baseplate assembly protein W